MQPAATPCRTGAAATDAAAPTEAAVSRHTGNLQGNYSPPPQPELVPCSWNIPPSLGRGERGLSCAPRDPPTKTLTPHVGAQGLHTLLERGQLFADRRVRIGHAKEIRHAVQRTRTGRVTHRQVIAEAAQRPGI